MKYIKHLLCFALLLWTASSCQRPDEKEAGKLDISHVVLEHIQDSYEWHVTDIGEKPLVIHLPIIVRSSTGWHVFCSSKFEEKADANGYKMGPHQLAIATKGDNEGKIVELVGGEAKASITVKQADVCTRLITSTEKVTFPKEGGTETVDIDTDGSDVKVEAKEGVTAEYSNGKLTLTAPANEGGTINGTVNLTCDEQAATINFTIEGSICPTCKGTGKVKCTKCGGKGYIETAAPHPAFPDEMNYYMFGCDKCGGRLDIRDPNYKEGSGKMPCPTCGGSGH